MEEMAALGRLLRSRRAGESGAAWKLPNLIGPESLALTSPHGADGSIPPQHAGRLAGGEDVSPQLAWSAPPGGTAQPLLVVENLRSSMGLGYHGPSPIEGHGPHQAPRGPVSGDRPGARAGTADRHV